MNRARQFLYGPPPRWPRPLDRALEGWARLPPRVRLLTWTLLLIVVVVQYSAYRDGLTERWGGEGVPLWQAQHTIPAGEDPRDGLRRVVLPPIAVPPAATGSLPEDPVLAMPLLPGQVLTDTHLSPTGISATLAADQRVLSVPVGTDLQLRAGAVVDVWAIDGSRGPPTLLAQGRPVLAVTQQGGRATVLLAVHREQVATATEAMAVGSLLLTLAPG